MSLLINILLILFASILQISLMPNLAIWHVFPNLILIISIILIFTGRNRDAFYWAALGGIALDLFSPYRFGIYTFSLLIIYFLLTYLVKKFFSDPNFLIATGLFIISALIFDLILFIYNPSWQIFIGEIIYNTSVGVMIYILAKNKLKIKDVIKIN